MVEINFTLEERRDRNGDTYLFAALPLFNAVMFLRPPRTGGVRWEGVIKPYRPRQIAADESGGYDWPQDDESLDTTEPKPTEPQQTERRRK